MGGGEVQTNSLGISIPAPARGATLTIRRPEFLHEFQFPPLREGRHAIIPQLLNI